jgi:hypothetical protein
LSLHGQCGRTSIAIYGSLASLRRIVAARELSGRDPSSSSLSLLKQTFLPLHGVLSSNADEYLSISAVPRVRD